MGHKMFMNQKQNAYTLRYISKHNTIILKQSSQWCPSNHSPLVISGIFVLDPIYYKILIYKKKL